MNDLNYDNLRNSKIKYHFAKTDSGELIFLNRAIKGVRYKCWGCDTRMYKRGGPKRTDHFYHKGDTCSSETALHEAFKYALYKRIIEGIKNNQEASNKKTNIFVHWICKKCQVSQEIDLLDKIADARLERFVDSFKPDISLYRENDSVYAVIEVEYKHSLDDDPRKFYEEKDIGIIEFMIEDEMDLARIYADPLEPNACNLCSHSTIEEKKNEMTNQQFGSQGNNKLGWFGSILLALGIGYIFNKFLNSKTGDKIRRNLMKLFKL